MSGEQLSEGPGAPQVISSNPEISFEAQLAYLEQRLAEVDHKLGDINPEITAADLETDVELRTAVTQLFAAAKAQGLEIDIR